MTPTLNSRRAEVGMVSSVLMLVLSVVSNAQAQAKIRPALEITFPNYLYSETANSLRDLDLENSELIIFGKKRGPDLHAYLRNGAYERRDKTGGDSVGFGWQKLISDESAGGDFALAYYTWVSWSGSASDFGVVQLLHIEGGHLKVLQQILFNIRGNEKAGAVLNANSEVLTISGLNEWEHCCPTGLDVVRFQVRRGLLKQTSYEKAPL